MLKKVVINASGGGKDVGASGNGIIEKDMTLLISKALKAALEKKGIEVLLLRDNDQTISYEDRIKLIKQKYGNDDDIIVISNTLNSGSNNGIEIIYALKEDDTLAKAIGDNLAYFNDTEYYQYRWPTDTSKDYYYITRNTPDYETIIIRYGYVNNAKDADVIKNDYQAMAEAVAEAITNYIGIVSDGYYIVKSGDTLYSIAKKFNTTVDNLKVLNNLNSNNLSIGQKLKLPNASENSSQINYYEVKKGDTLYSIAKKFAMSVEALKSLNNLTSNLISIGQLLKVGELNKYVVQKGDTLYALSKKYGTTVEDIKKINNLDSDNLTIGMVLNIP